MIQHAFTSAYENQIRTQNQGINTITSGIKDAAVLAAGIAGFSGALGQGALAKGAEHALAGRVGGIGGNIMLATIQEKKATAKVKESQDNLFSTEDVSKTINSQLGDNPINRAAKKSLNTVFETLVKAKEEKILNKEGQIESSLGNIDPNSELGKKILKEIEE